jgi:hypothetical protein
MMGRFTAAYRIRARGDPMAKALYGFHGRIDPRVEAELATLRARVRQLEAEVAELRSHAEVSLVPEDLDLALLTSRDAALV